MIANDSKSPESLVERGEITADGTHNEASVVRSEERLRIQTQMQPWARARLRRFVVTETQIITVPVRREYVVLETAPYLDAGWPDHGGSSDENAVLINEEVAEVGTTIRPVARVRIGVESRTEQQTISAELAREHVTVDGHVQDYRT